jgi:hypothetical protein
MSNSLGPMLAVLPEIWVQGSHDRVVQGVLLSSFLLVAGAVLGGLACGAVAGVVGRAARWLT